MADTPPRFTLRQLPVPAKLVVTAFLLSVGLGYTSAMIQLHMKHSDRDGQHLPTVENVVAVFAGKRWQPAGGEGEKVVSRLEALVTGNPKGELNSKNMAPAFFAHDGADYQKRADEKPDQLPRLDAERDGERAAFVAWVNAPPDARQQAYDTDRFHLPPALAGRPLTNAYKVNGGAVKIHSLVRDRCTRCHRPGGDKGDVPLTTYKELARHMPAAVPVPPGGGWVDSGKLISLERLTQSTHAHLLSFSMLFSLTGMVFAFTSYPGIVRGVLGPLVLVAQVTDVALWWLARLENGGPYFAMGIVGTGMVVATGLGLQIVLSVFNMYGPKGKLVLALLFAAAGGLGGVAYKKVVAPYLEGERAGKAAEKTPASSPVGPPRLEKLLVWSKAGPDGSPLPAFDLPRRKNNEIDLDWKGKQDGGMARAFFDKDGADFKALLKDATDEEVRRLFAERDGERLAILAWLKLAADARQASYESDRFTLPAELAGKPLTADYKADGGSVKVKSILTDRCARCHQPGADKEDIPLHTYEGLRKYLEPEPVEGGGKAVAADAAPANGDPIPAARE
jgi:hypothetical protein